nr:DNA polymerase [Rickettsia endosymbiont of Ceutorhynchus assimilis]
MSFTGWTLQQLLHLDISINKVNPLKASSYLPLPKEIDAKKAVLNIQNQDQKCFMWSVLAHLHPVDRTQNANRVVNYMPFENELDFTGMEFPIKLKDISKFEQLNNISINVYGLDNAYENGRNIIEVVGPLYFTQSRKANHVNLLLISNDSGDSHYCLIRNMSRLISSQLSKHDRQKYLCDGCLMYFSTEQKLKTHQEHDCAHVSVKLPTTDLKKNKYGEEVPENILKFINFEKKLKVPFVCYADFETIIEPVDAEENELDPENSYTVKTHKAVPYSFAYYIKCDFDDSHSIFKTFREPDAHKVFVEWLEADCKSIYNQFMKNIVPMHPLSQEQENEFRNAKKCHICEKPFKVEDERVRDHCHFTGNFRAAGHSVCNLNFKTPNFIPIFFHCMSNFDSHLFVKELAQENERLDVIPQNKERYISFTKHVLVDKIPLDQSGKQKQVFLKLRFLDSFRFMASSLDKLSQNLKPEQCREVRNFFPAEDEFQIIRQKGVFPYSYVDSFSKLDDIKLPSIDGFYNDLRKEGIKQEDYKRAKKAWNLFQCRTLGEYSDIYLKSDVLILADVLENFRDVCQATYGLDPCQYYTAPGLSFDAALKTTAVELELLIDIDMIHFLKGGIRGGVSQCSVRKAVANNIFISHYDASKPTSYLMYLDATNLYGAAMSQYLPTGNFKWLDVDEIQNLDYLKLNKNSNTGYIFEVDLVYPEDLHYRHNELPFCPESFAPEGSKIKKLIPNFNRKEKYVIHLQNLQQALQHGLKLEKIHRVLTFNQSPWLKIYIDLNTAKRNAASNKFEKDFFKLMNNAVFGKTMENVEKRVDIKLITHWENIGRKLGAEAWISKPHFKDVTIFGENLVAIHMAKQKVIYDKPIYVGFAILDISKTIMYDFLYSYIKPKYGNKATLLYTDTDSLILNVETPNFYHDMKENLDKFDTSNYSQATHTVFL